MITWILETDMFHDRHVRLADAVRDAGQHVLEWEDDWWATGDFPELCTDLAVFHGSLGNASRIVSELSWHPGAFCQTSAFACSAWYSSAKEHLAHRAWRIVPADQFVREPESVMSDLGLPNKFFVRPDSPLKPFSGRVLDLEGLSLAALDHGFYYDDPTIPIVVAPLIDIEREWRFVAVEGRVVAGSGYEAESRSESVLSERGTEWAYAQSVVESLPPPELAYVLDVCLTDGELRLLELNPFSGADLYACERRAIVEAITASLSGTT